MFSRAKWLPASMGGTSSARRVRIALVLRPHGPHCQHWAEMIFERFQALCHCDLIPRVAFYIGMAASNSLSGRWGFEIARNPVFSRIKWLLASMGGSSSVRRVWIALLLRATGPQRMHGRHRANRRRGCHRVQRGRAAH